MPVQYARVKEIIPRTADVKSFRLDPGEIADFAAGQFLSVALGEGKEYKRYLSISNSPTEKGYLEFTKKLTGSDFSRALVALAVGSQVKIEYPFGKFTLDPACRKAAFLCGGIGITPVRSIAKYTADKKQGTDILLFYANRTVEGIIFRQDFELIQKTYPSLRILYLLSEGPPQPGYISGRIDAQIIKDNAPDYAERKFFLCGPPAMVEAMRVILSAELGLPKENIITESFQGYT